MKLQVLQKQLASELQQNNQIKIIHEMSFCIPVHSMNVTYHPVLKKPMDILMKMMLLSFKQGDFRNGEALADVLLVEPLFINDLLQKMQKTGLLRMEAAIKLTEKGEQQLEEGIYEEELDEQSHILQFSPIHNHFLTGDIESVLDFDDFPEVLPYAQDLSLPELEDQEIIELLQQEILDEEIPTYITSIISTEELQINDVPCPAFILYEASSDTLFARVYNTLTNQWDESLATFLHEKERSSWREKYL
ncbi:nucleoside-diphosphate sugar epimerase [Lysinibacillus sp. 54212]|uniref:nucleoside-diphosphate sugar epimerase n=1 Tax=Lysinibacillus sp. 54212 TaxID=3119829 RepID=UPI002FC7044B